MSNQGPIASPTGVTNTAGTVIASPNGDTFIGNILVNGGVVDMGFGTLANVTNITVPGDFLIQDLTTNGTPISYLGNSGYSGGGTASPSLTITSNVTVSGTFGLTSTNTLTPAGNTTVVASGSGSTCRVDTSYSGGIGSTGYTVGDLVKILKTAGIIKQ